MPEYDKTEREIIDHFKKEYIMLAQEKAVDDIYRMLVRHKYGAGLRDPMLPVDWKKVFEENQCPACQDMISLKEKQYVCEKCNLTIPLELYDLAVKQFKNRQAMLKKDRAIRKKIKENGVRGHRIELLYQAALGEAVDELEALEKKRGGRVAEGGS